VPPAHLQSAAKSLLLTVTVTRCDGSVAILASDVAGTWANPASCTVSSEVVWRLDSALHFRIDDEYVVAIAPVFVHVVLDSCSDEMRKLLSHMILTISAPLVLEDEEMTFEDVARSLHESLVWVNPPQ